ncbi:MAG: twitching motility protein PilT [Ignavibacteria bacterium GWB2_35_6b]|nr:MAG: twitching motility protein PilT [Ignavibacteria bacterium GWB2_35_6b]
MVTVDTHIVIWNALQAELISSAAEKALQNANENGSIIFPDIILWEIAMLVKKKRLIIESSYKEFINLLLASNNYQLQEITPEIAELSTELPGEINLDPADRIIAATSIILNAPLITADKNLLKAKKIKTIW